MAQQFPLGTFQESVVFAERAPHDKDKGMFWIFYDDTTTKLFIRDVKRGAWKGPVSFT